MIFATGSIYSQGISVPDWVTPVMGVVVGLAIITGAVAVISSIRS